MANLHAICQQIKKVDSKTFTLTGGAKFRIAYKHRNINTSHRVSKDLLCQMISDGRALNEDAKTLQACINEWMKDIYDRY